MHRSRLIEFIFLILSLNLALSTAEKTRRVLQIDGYAEDSFSVLFKTKSAAEKITSVSAVAKDTSIVTHADASHNGKNVTVQLEMEGQVGQTQVTVRAQTDSRSTAYEEVYVIDVLGVAFTSEGSSKGAIVSGESGAGISFSSYLQSPGGMTLRGRAYAGDGEFIALSKAKAAVKEPKSKKDTKLLDREGVTFDSDSVKIVPNEYRVGSGEVIVEIEHPDIEVDGEAASTFITVRMGNDPYPNPVVVGPADNKKVAKLDLSSSKKAAAVEMFNLIGRPDVGRLEAVRGVVSNKTLFSMDRSLSELGEPDQIVRFVLVDQNVTKGKYKVLVEAEYSGGEVLAAIQENDLIVDVTESSSLLGKKARNILIGAGLGILALLVACSLLIYYWRRSVTASRNLDSSYSQVSGAQPFGVPAPIAALDDGILRDSYARNESTFSNDESSGNFEIQSIPANKPVERKNSDKPASEYSV